MKLDRLQNSFLVFVALVGFSIQNVEAQSHQQNSSTESVIYVDSTKQIIRGFGAANIVGWRPDMTDTDIQNAFGNEEGELGLSILRIRIPPNEDQWEQNLPTAQQAHDMGIKVMASPWTPPAYMKTNNDPVGGRLAEEYYGEYAAYLNDFAEYMEENGVPLYGISVQNEPDIEVGYESCDWSPEEMTTFIREHADSINTTRLIAPESFQFRRPISDAILNDSVAASKVDIIGGHIYGGGLSEYDLAHEKDKEIWMTEYLMNKDATSDWESLSDEVIWEESIEMLGTIQSAMSLNWNAYIWWYLKRYYSFIGDGDQRTVSGEVLKRGYAFSHFSKFVRPGYVRVKADEPFGRGFTNVSVTAYKDTADSKLVLVAVNGETSDKEIDFYLKDRSTTAFTPYITSLDQTVETMEEVEVTEGRFTMNLPAQSVITFVADDLVASSIDEKPDQPNSFQLQQNYPNPFNPTTVISYQLPASSQVTLKVFDMLGREVTTLVDEKVSAGEHHVQFDASNLSSGIYVYRLRAGNFTQTRQMTLIK